MIEYKERDLLGGWSMAVVVNGATLGHIRKDGQDGSFVYYKGPHNQMNWSLYDADLEVLKTKIEASF